MSSLYLGFCHPGGMPEISRWLSEATPPDPVPNDPDPGGVAGLTATPPGSGARPRLYPGSRRPGANICDPYRGRRTSRSFQRIETVLIAGSEFAGITGRPAPVDGENVAVHVAVFRVRQEQSGNGNLIRRSRAAEGDMVEHALHRMVK